MSSTLSSLIGSQATGALASTASPIIGPTAAALLFGTTRSLAGVIPDIVVEERHTDQLMITEHPVEQGAPITDHAFKVPPEVVVRAGWSNSGIAGLVDGGLDESRVRRIYEQLLTIQASRQPFMILTGKRIYKNMLFREISVETDKHTEYCLFVEAVCRNVRIVQTASTAVTPTSTQANPASTASVVNVGQVQTTQVSPQVAANFPWAGSDTSATAA